MKYFLALLFVIFFSLPAFAEDEDSRIKSLEDTLKEQQRQIDNLNSQQDSSKTSGEGGKATGLFGGSALSNPSISLIMNTFFYSSNLKNGELDSRNIPGYTTAGIDKQNGFNLDSAEFFIFATVDPYFNLYANLPVTVGGMEIEEAYVVTTALPEGWQSKFGKFKSNFSRLDAQHPHAWDFSDIALPYRAFLGDEGLGGEKGVQLTYLPLLPIYTQLGIEALQGENDLIFGKAATEAPHAFSFFVKSSVDVGDYSTLYFGPSILFGKTDNANILADAQVHANSALYGLEGVWKWKAASREALTIQSEYLLLTQSGTATEAATGIVDSLKRKQDGFYIQGIYRKNRWGIGLRYDALNLFYDNFKRADAQQDFGGKPWRETASLEFNPTEFTRIRLQFTHDRSDPNERINNEAILQFNFSIGAHPTHSF